MRISKYIPAFLALLLSLASFGQAELKPQFDKATGYLKSQEYQKAINEFTEILNKATETKVKKFALIYRGFAYNGVSKFAAAIADFDKAIELDPEDLGTYIDRGQSKIYANDLPAALTDFEYVLSKDSVNQQGQNAFFYMASIAYKKGEFESSIDYYTKLIVLTPGDPEIYFN